MYYTYLCTPDTFGIDKSALACSSAIKASPKHKAMYALAARIQARNAGTWRGSIGGDGGAGTGIFWSADAVGSRCKALRKHNDPNSRLATGIAYDCRELMKTIIVKN